MRSLGAADSRPAPSSAARAPRSPPAAAERHVGEAAQGGDGRTASSSTRRRSAWPRSATGGNRLAGTRGHELSADYVALQSRLAGLNVSRQDFDYDLFCSATGSRRCSTSGAASTTSRASRARSRGGDFGSMVNSRLGRRHRAGVGRRPDDPVAGRRTRRPPAARPPTSPACRRARSCCSSAAPAASWPSCSTRRRRARARSSTSTRATPASRTTASTRAGSTMTGAGVTVPIVAAQIATVADLAGSVRAGPRRQDRAAAGRVPRRARRRPRT